MPDVGTSFHDHIAYHSSPWKVKIVHISIFLQLSSCFHHISVIFRNISCGNSVEFWIICMLLSRFLRKMSAFFFFPSPKEQVYSVNYPMVSPENYRIFRSSYTRLISKKNCSHPLKPVQSIKDSFYWICFIISPLPPPPPLAHWNKDSEP